MPSLKNLWFLRRRQALNLEDLESIGELSGHEFAALLQQFISLPTGLCVPFAASIVYVGGAQVWQPVNPVPPGWLLCDGQAVGRIEYRRLFEAVGTAFGTGDGSTTFNVPNIIDRYVKGVGTTGGLNAPAGSLTHEHVAAGSHDHFSAGGHGHAADASNNNRNDIQAGGGASVATSAHGHNINAVGNHSHGFGGSHAHGVATSHDPSHIHLLWLIKT
jgi:microcystin-dependent protein